MNIKIAFCSLFFCLTFNVISQELIIDKHDDFENFHQKSTKYYPVGDTTKPFLFLKVMHHWGDLGNSYAICVYTSEFIGCSGKPSNQMILLFDDLNRMRFLNDRAPVNCNNGAISYFLADEVYVDLFLKNVKGIRLIYENKYIDVLFQEKQYTMKDLFIAVLEDPEGFKNPFKSK